jgi:D-tagatose-1,6-bisphosphate aldolase subunit GatZ/KbaZ
MVEKDHHLLKLVRDHKNDYQRGIFSVCSSNLYVVEASILNAKEKDQYLLIESTSNQVDQYGGYTGLTPIDFKKQVLDIAKRNRFPKEQIILGGDHLGPNVWQNEKSADAMIKAENQITSYVSAGYTKVHLDTSMKCIDDGELDKPLEPVIIAERAANLCEISEKIFNRVSPNVVKPVYVIGTDVPPPGGSKSNHLNKRITLPEEVDETIHLTEKAFKKRNLDDAWPRVIAVVVQPGVEFSDSDINEYDHNLALPLVRKIEENKNLVYEAHSTDYQKKNSLRKMIKDHFAVLKVGPWLTFAFREAVFALNNIEKKWLGKDKSVILSELEEVVDQQMNADPQHWKKYYNGSETQVSFARKYSFSDRIRYYWANKYVVLSLERLINNLTKKPVPLALLSQYLPNQYNAIRDGRINNEPKSIIINKIINVIENYNYAIEGGKE